MEGGGRGGGETGNRREDVGKEKGDETEGGRWIGDS